MECAIRMAFLWYTQELGYKAGSEITKDMSGGILQDIWKRRTKNEPRLAVPSCHGSMMVC